jgi:hypothetical protein
MSKPEEPLKPSLSMGYATESPEDIQLILEQLTLEERKEPVGVLTMDTHGSLVLDDSNYGRWKVEMMATLVMHGLDKIATGRLPKPANENTPESQDWDEKDAQAKLLLWRSLPSGVFQHTQGCKTAAEVYKCVVDLKEPKAANIIHGLKMQLYCMTWDKDDTVSSFWSKLMVIVDKIRATGKEVDSSDIISRVLTSLPDKFSMFKSNWEYNSTSELTVEEFKDKLVMAELGLKGSGKKENSELAFEVRVKKEEESDPALDRGLVARGNRDKGYSSTDNKCSSCHNRCLSCHSMMVCPQCLVNEGH